jgi:ComF family protein
MVFPASTLLKNAAQSALDALLPPLCCACGGLTAKAHAFCASCWGELNFITPPYCACCGVPFEYSIDQGALCGACMMEKPLFVEARAPLSYDDESRALILPFKSADRTDYAPAFARLMLQSAAEIIQKSDVIVPVPLHVLRLFARRYNQAAMLALGIGKASNKKVLLQALHRRKRTPSQGTLHRNERKRNVAGAFAVNPAMKKHLQGKAVLLIDDVLTTGATANACAKVLLAAGAKEVRVLALARVKKAD